MVERSSTFKQLMSLKFRGLLVLLVGTALGLSLSLGSGVLAQRSADAPQPDELPWDDARLLAEVLERVKQEYVEPVDDHRLIEAAVRGMVMDLDPHSRFLDTDEYAEIRINTTGSYTGVGLELNVRDGQVVVVSPIEGTPADRAGIRANDVILAIDGEPVTDGNIAACLERMRGQPGTTVALRIARAGTAEPLEYKLLRSHVEVHSVRHQLLEDGYGYLRLTHFSETTYKDLRRAINALQNDAPGGLRGLVLDLRNNPGGVLDAAVEVADAFLDEGLIVSASGRGRESNFSHRARPGDLLDGAALVVLVNEGSASASEIVAGALQDNKRALIAGSQTYGKGSVQTVMPLSNGRAIKLTTSRYFTPAGRSIQDRGIEPDVPLPPAEREDAQAAVTEHRRDPGQALLQTDRQLRAAVELLSSGRIVQSRAD